MSKFTIVCDSACDLSLDVLSKRGIAVVPLSFRFNGEGKEYKSYSINIKDFYDKMRGGDIAKTAGVNIYDFRAVFEPILKDGKDILYLGFSSELSITLNSARMAATELKREYPNRQIATIDTLCASAGIALLLDIAVEERDRGSDLSAVVRLLEEKKLKVCHWFTVDDLVYLKRGGRISAASALVGSMLGIKPILHVDSHGRLVPKFKVRGRMGAINALVNKFCEECGEERDIYISHADCLGDAKLLADKLEKKHSARLRLITDVSPVIGSHSGPGTLALFFIGKERRSPD